MDTLGRHPLVFGILCLGKGEFIAFVYKGDVAIDE